jgi:hypothetical protein
MEPGVLWLTWTFRGLGISGLLLVPALVLFLSAAEADEPKTQTRGSRQRKKTKRPGLGLGWEFWAVTGLLAIPTLAVLTAAAPILGAIFILLVLVAIYDVLTEWHGGPATRPPKQVLAMS